jgi:hypothetical protein
MGVASLLRIRSAELPDGRGHELPHRRARSFHVRDLEDFFVLETAAANHHDNLIARPSGSAIGMGKRSIGCCVFIVRGHSISFRFMAR